MRNTYLLLSFCFFTTTVIAQKKTYWMPEQTIKMKNITSVRPSPDGSKVAYTVREAIMTDDRSEYINQIFLSNADGSNTFLLTRNDKNNINPKWSPDGA
ncbi:MAG: TolB family protein, partial [Chitinophagaceae bacterium]